MKNNVLYYSVGPLLYCPANRISITDSLINERFGNRFSLALCLEDTINDDHVEEAEQILISSLSQIFIQHEQKPFYLPKIFIRVRNPQQIQRLTKALGQSIKIVTGFIVPKFSPDNAQSYIEQMILVNELVAEMICAICLGFADMPMNLFTASDLFQIFSQILSLYMVWIM